MPLVAGSIADLARAPELRAALDWFRRERTWINDQHLKLCRVPAPTFLEQKRAEWMAERFQDLGWESRLDRSGNVVAALPGRRDSAAVAITAHLDTVLAPRSPDEIKLSGDGRLLGPGVSDNGAGLAALLALAAAWNAAPPLPDAPLSPVLIANVGEEGEGNLSGMRYLCRDSNGSRPKAFLVLDGPSTDLNLIVSEERAQSASRVMALTGEQVIQTADWTEVFVCCLSGGARLTNTAGEVATLRAVDVARCAPADGEIRCAALGSGTPNVFVAAVRLRSA